MKILINGGGISNNALIKLLDKDNIEYDIEDNKGVYDYVVRTPGTMREKVKALGKIITDIELISLLYNKEIIGITGTNGKTSTTLLIHHLMKKHYKCQLGGNIGIPYASIVKEKGIKILELSSFELEGTISFKPHVALILNITPAHLDYHKSMDEYIKAKAKLIQNMNENDFIIYNKDDSNVLSLVSEAKAKLYSFSLNSMDADAYYKNGRIIVNKKEYNIKDFYSTSKADLKNIMAVILTTNLYLIPYKAIIKGLKSFKKPKYRMEKITERIYNDAKSTNIYSTTESLKEFKEVILISGGYDRLDNLDELKPYLDKVKVFYLYGENRFRYEKFLKKNNKAYHSFANLNMVINEVIKEDGIILFSPMAPSYDQFKDYKERGAYFERKIKKAIKAFQLKMWYLDCLDKYRQRQIILIFLQ